MANIAFVDIETTGLDAEKHEILEIAIITDPFDDVVHISLPINIDVTTEQALAINKYYERQGELLAILETREAAAHIVHDTLQGHVFIGNNPSFDAAFLKKLLADFNLQPSWHYHLVDIKSLVGGMLGIKPPWSTDRISELLGVDNADMHTALADAEWDMKIYKKLLLEKDAA